MIKRVVIIAALLVLLLSPAASAEASLPEENFSPAELAERLNTGEMEEELNALDRLLAEEGADISLSRLWQDMLSGEQPLTLSSLWQVLSDMLWGQLKKSSSLLGQLILLSLLAVVLTLLKDRLAAAETAETGRWVIYLLLIGLATNAFIPCLETAGNTVNTLEDILCALLPLLVPLLAAIGGVTTVTLMDPALLFAVSLMMGLMSRLIFPLICFSTLLQLCGGISPRVKLDKLAALCKDIALGVMGVTVTVFVAFLGFSGMAAAGTDGLAVKAVKSAAGTFIPVVGRSLADAFDSVLGTALILKNAIGLMGAIAVLLICAMPAIHILLQSLVFKAAGALIQPLGEDRLAESVSGMGKSLTLLFAALAICGLFAYFALALIVGLGNMAMMMR